MSIEVSSDQVRLEFCVEDLSSRILTDASGVVHEGDYAPCRFVDPGDE